MQVFRENGRFYKGNLHCHTTRSDGSRSPKEVVEIYRGLGYDFLALTDHRSVTVDKNHLDQGMLLLTGIELDYQLVGEVVHIVGYGMTKDIMRIVDYREGPQGGIDAIRHCGGQAIIAHPHWSLNTLPTLMGMNGVIGAEVYNSVSIMRPDSSEILDVAATHGKLIPFVANDDSHGYDGEQGMSYTMVQADELSADGIKRAMAAGLFYASQGPRFEQIAVEDGRVIVRCSPVERVYFHSNLPWTPGRFSIGSGLTSAVYALNTDMGERYVRVQLIDAAGRSAWSSPIAL